MLLAAGFIHENHVKAAVEATEKAKTVSAAEESIEGFLGDVVQASDKAKKKSCSVGLKMNFGSIWLFE